MVWPEVVSLVDLSETIEPSVSLYQDVDVIKLTLLINGGKLLPANFFLLGRDGLRRGGGVSSI